MARYIDADALTEMLNKKAQTDLEMGLYNHGTLTQSFIRFVERQPTADVAPRAEWISVEDRLPDIDPYGKGRYGGARSVRVLCACKQRSGRTFAKEGYYEPCGNGKVFWRIPGSVDSVTHWMPLPEPPKGAFDERRKAD